MNDYYVYGHFNAITGQIFYVGKGRGYRAAALHRRSVAWHNYVKKYGYIIKYLETNLTQEESFEKEVYYIKKYGRRDLKTGCLVNMSDGGVGGNNNKGRKLSAEWRRKIGEAGRGRPGAMLGKTTPEETKRKISEALKGVPRPWMRGRVMSENQMLTRTLKKPCEHCGAMVNIGNYNRWHGENCKHKNGMIIKLPKIHPGIKLTEAIVIGIREEFNFGKITIGALAKKHGVSRTAISDIVNNKSWKMVA